MDASWLPREKVIGFEICISFPTTQLKKYKEILDILRASENEVQFLFSTAEN